jgi:hypothetical protein
MVGQFYRTLSSLPVGEDHAEQRPKAHVETVHTRAGLMGVLVVVFPEACSPGR